VKNNVDMAAKKRKRKADRNVKKYINEAQLYVVTVSVREEENAGLCANKRMEISRSMTEMSEEIYEEKLFYMAIISDNMKKYIYIEIYEVYIYIGLRGRNDLWPV